MFGHDDMEIDISGTQQINNTYEWYGKKKFENPWHRVGMYLCGGPQSTTGGLPT